ncbi:hypothetical protein Amsp01_032580 [Amycolatopsis sp. NBRC 101858]|uniref:TIGR02391 family protein n=1 Tax=Amycolatopsis sp. NBRC 101858 TaxID=3032200 RepID=UPI0024A4CDC2|nr:TIGR02391 family protein [Amycolatopsis sp. NBRC 101858]GLY37234.1 hypothetical protein Amsp01_032580 [Amycolatopsis sp. NBRC 101858]
MNKKWSRERLETYLSAVRHYQSMLRSSQGFDQDAYEEVIRLEPAAKAIMKRVNPDYRDYQFVQSAHDQAFTLTIQSLALLNEAEEIEANLGMPGPQLAAGEFHPWVWDAARSLWETRHYREAVQAAATSINAHLQDRAGRRDISDYKLAAELFSEKPPEARKPRLRWSGAPEYEEFKSMQAGLRGFSAGVFQCIRNPATHDLSELSEQAALERLAAMSLYCRLVDECSLDEVDT